MSNGSLEGKEMSLKNFLENSETHQLPIFCFDKVAMVMFCFRPWENNSVKNCG